MRRMTDRIRLRVHFIVIKALGSPEDFLYLVVALMSTQRADCIPADSGLSVLPAEIADLKFEISNESLHPAAQVPGGDFRFEIPHFRREPPPRCRSSQRKSRISASRFQTRACAPAWPLIVARRTSTRLIRWTPRRGCPRCAETSRRAPGREASRSP